MKPKPRGKSIGAGISLEPELIERAKELAIRRGFTGLSPFVRVLLHAEINSHSHLLMEGNPHPQPHSGEGASNIHKPYGGGSKTPEVKYEKKRRAK